MSRVASSKTTSVAGESTGEAKYMFLSNTSGVEATEEPHTHTPPRCSKSRHTKQNPDEEISIQMCCLRLHEKYRHTQRENVKHAKRCQSPCSATWACASVSVQVHGAPPSIHKTPTMLTVRPKAATDRQDAHTCNRGRPCQNSGGSL